MQLVGAINSGFQVPAPALNMSLDFLSPVPIFQPTYVHLRLDRHDSFVCKICNFSTGRAISPTASPLTMDPACKLAGALPSA